MGESKKYYFKEGEEVIHKECPNQKLFIESILKEVYPIAPKDPSGKQQTSTKILGIKCHWWDKDGKFFEGKFHKSEILPYEVGFDSTELERMDWLEKNNSY